MIKIFEAFAGYGTASFALKQLNIKHELVGFSEIDKYAIQCFEQNHGGKNFGDIKNINWNKIPEFDLLTGGFSCQPFSLAGKGLGVKDNRGELANYLTKALIVKQPKYFMFENVKGFMSKRHEEFRKKLLKDWREAGYKVVYKVLNTREHGIPQNRSRVFFIGHRLDVAPSFVNPFRFPEPTELKLKLKDLLEESVDEKYFLKKEQVAKIMAKVPIRSARDRLQKKDYDNTLTARDYKSPKCIRLQELTKGLSDAQRIYDSNGCAKTLKGLGGGQGAKTGLYVVSHSLFPRSSKTGKGGTGHLKKEDGTSYCLDTGNCQAVEFVEPTALDLYNKKARTDYSPCLSLPHHNSLRLGVGTRVRRLTPKECFRLQGFLKDEVDLDGLSDTQKYKLAGNGQSVNVVKLIFSELLRGRNNLNSNKTPKEFCKNKKGLEE